MNYTIFILGIIVIFIIEFFFLKRPGGADPSTGTTWEEKPSRYQEYKNKRNI